MSEKRYEIRTNSNGEYWLFDNKYDKAMMISKIRATLLVVCNRLNEQQATIQRLQFDLKECRARKEIMGEKLKKYQDIAKEYDCVSSVKLAEKIDEQQVTIQSLKEENSNLNSILNEVGLQKPFIKILDDYMIEYDGSCFSMHKPSDIRSFVYLMNRNNNFDELQCEYNDESMVIDDE